MTIKHLVLSGGSWKGLYMIGALDKLIDNKFIVLNEIETIWATSVGTIVSLLLTLNIDWKDILEYFVNIPLKHEEVNLDYFIKVFNTCGILDQSFLIKLLDSVFKAKHLDLKNITLKEYYEFNGKDIHFFAVNFDTMNTRNFNYKTDPNIKLLDVVYCSCTFPMLFQPIKIENTIYIDGGINDHYPLKYCLENNNPDEVCGIYIKTKDCLSSSFKNSLEFASRLIYKIVFSKQQNEKNDLKHQLLILTNGKSMSEIFELIKQKEKREEIINAGKILGQEFLDNRPNEFS